MTLESKKKKRRRNKMLKKALEASMAENFQVWQKTFIYIFKKYGQPQTSNSKEIRDQT